MSKLRSSTDRLSYRAMWPIKQLPITLTHYVICWKMVTVTWLHGWANVITTYAALYIWNNSVSEFLPLMRVDIPSKNGFLLWSFITQPECNLYPWGKFVQVATSWPITRVWPSPRTGAASSTCWRAPASPWCGPGFSPYRIQSLINSTQQHQLSGTPPLESPVLLVVLCSPWVEAASGHMSQVTLNYHPNLSVTCQCGVILPVFANIDVIWQFAVCFSHSW